VFFGTDRKQGETKKSKLGEDVATFGVVSDRKLLYGRAEVTVPRSDKVRERGSITRPGWELFGFRVVLPGMSEDPATHFTVKSVKPLSKAEFLDDVARRFADGRTFKNQALLFVHGYNVSFEDALYRAAQITHDIGFDGAPLLYSWPSIARATGYLYDAEQVKGARRYLREFVETIARETQVSDLHIVAHSMGAEAMVEVLRELGTVATAKADLKINQIILAAPDIDRENFEQLAETIVGLARGGVTLYASNNDTALRASRQLRLGRYRAGDVPPEGPILIKGIDTIDITRASTDFFSLNHTLFIERLKLINDMRLIFERGLRPPDQRSTESVFKPVTTDRGIYWQYLN
jgi:esterase/lipase superfamily enzyme